jgi:hypothetical protein
MNIAKKVEIYIRLRDRRSDRKKAFEAADEGDKLAQEKIEALIMQQFNEDGTDSLKTEFGTAYRSMKTTASVADWDAVFEFIQSKDYWHMLEKRVNKTAVEQYMEDEGKLPPGVNVTRVQSINVRRS